MAAELDSFASMAENSVEMVGFMDLAMSTTAWFCAGQQDFFCAKAVLLNELPDITWRSSSTSMDLGLHLEDMPSLVDQHGPIFIVGCPRSGTTFLSRCLARVEAIEEFVGVLAPPRMMHMIGSQSARGENVRSLLLLMRDLFWQGFWRRRYSRSERLVQVIKGNKSALNLARKPGLKDVYFCYKEPFLCFAMEQVADHFPNSKLIHIIRDGRDNADSMERTYPHALSDRVLTDELLANNNNSEIGVYRVFDRYYLPWWIPSGEEERFIGCSRFGRTVWMWKEMVSRVIRCGRKLDPRRYLELRYESVVTHPVESAQLILQFLGFKASKRLLRQLKNARATSVGISQKRQAQDRLDEARAIASDLLHELGYI